MTEEQVLEEILAYLSSNRHLLNIDKDCPITAEISLYGHDGILDSLHLIHLVVSMEKYVRNKTNAPVVLADAKAFSYQQSPFSSPKNFATYIVGLLTK